MVINDSYLDLNQVKGMSYIGYMCKNMSLNAYTIGIEILVDGKSSVFKYHINIADDLEEGDMTPERYKCEISKLAYPTYQKILRQLIDIK